MYSDMLSEQVRQLCAVTFCTVFAAKLSTVALHGLSRSAAKVSTMKPSHHEGGCNLNSLYASTADLAHRQLGSPRSSFGGLICWVILASQKAMRSLGCFRNEIRSRTNRSSAHIQLHRIAGDR